MRFTQLAQVMPTTGTVSSSEGVGEAGAEIVIGWFKDTTGEYPKPALR